jgi:hypothetical protein
MNTVSLNSNSISYTGPLWTTDYGYYFCSNCHYVLGDDFVNYKHKNYCENCGNKLDWSQYKTAGVYINKVQFLVDTLNLSVDEVKNYEMSQIDKAIEAYLFTEDKQNVSQTIFELRNHS